MIASDVQWVSAVSGQTLLDPSGGRFQLSTEGRSIYWVRQKNNKWRVGIKGGAVQNTIFDEVIATVSRLCAPAKCAISQEGVLIQSLKEEHIVGPLTVLLSSPAMAEDVEWVSALSGEPLLDSEGKLFHLSTKNRSIREVVRKMSEGWGVGGCMQCLLS